MGKKSSSETMKNLGGYFFTIIVVAFAVILLIYTKEVSIAVTNSINTCLTIIIPSLFCFMVISGILVKSNIYVLISKPFALISKYVFRIPPQYFSIFLLSNIGGYPIGAKLIGELLKEDKISKENADEMLCYCYCSGPAFVIGTVGIKVFSSVYTGFLIYLSIVISNMIIAFIMGLRKKIPKSSTEKIKLKFNSNTLVEAVESSSKSMILICGMIVFFASVISVISEIGLTKKLSYFLETAFLIPESNANSLTKSILEISNITQLSHYCYTLIPFISGIISFGGICVVLQIKAISGNKIGFKKFIVTRPFQIVLSGIISYFLIKRFAKEIVIMTITNPVINHDSKSNIIPSILIIIMTILLLKKNNSRFIKKGVI